MKFRVLVAYDCQHMVLNKEMAEPKWWWLAYRDSKYFFAAILMFRMLLKAPVTLRDGHLALAEACHLQVLY